MEMSYNDSPINSPNTSASLPRSVSSKQFFTPCRQLGLKRKPGSAKTDGSSASKLFCVSTPTSGTPKGPPRLPLRKKLLASCENDVTKCASDGNKVECESTFMHNDKSLLRNKTDAFKSEVNDTVSAETQQSIEFSFEEDTISSAEKAKKALEDLKKQIDSKEKLLNSLQQRLHKMKKGNEHVSRLKNLQADWKEACQVALRDLLDKTNLQGQFLSMKQLMEKLGISNELLPYNSDDEEFGDNY